MKANHWLLLVSLLVPPLAQAADNDPPLELLELLGEIDDEEVDLEIAMADVRGEATPKTKLPEEVKDDE
jgi:hypothetical protein